jgi:hypothetical protein
MMFGGAAAKAWPPSRQRVAKKWRKRFMLQALAG